MTRCCNPGFSCLLLVLITAGLKAQTIVNSSDIASWDTLIFNAADGAALPFILPGDTGAQTWNFSGLVSRSFDSLQFVNPAATPDGYFFKNANLCMIRTDGYYIYLDNSPAGLYIVGVAADVLQTGTPLAGNVSPPLKLLGFPAKAGDSLFQSAVIKKTIDAASAGISGFDSVRYTRTITYDGKINAFGTITTPLGSFDALRQEVNEISNDYARGEVYNLGILVFSKVLYDKTNIAHYYKWWTSAPGAGFPVADITVDANGAVSGVNFLVSINGTAGYSTPVSCSDSCDGVSGITLIKGTPPYYFQWDNDTVADTSAFRSGLCAGTHRVKITDSTGSSVNIEAVINSPLALAGMINVTSASCDSCSGCAACSDGSASAIAWGGTPPYTFAWNDPNAQTTANAVNLPIGKYAVVITDSKGCSTSLAATIGLFMGVKLYPNPAASDVQIFSRTPDEERTFILFDLSGKQVMYARSGDKITKIDLSSLSAGLYIYHVIAGNGEILLKGKLNVMHTQK